MSSPTPGLPQRRITKSIINITGERSKHPLKEMSQYVLPNVTGKQFGKLTVISDEAIKLIEQTTGRKRILVQTQCQCGTIAWKNWDNLKRRIAGCRECDNPRKAPLWLVQRAIAAKGRCENPHDPRYQDYGGRGIRFQFSSPTAMAVYLMEHFKINQRMQIDRINNNSDYAPGNIRMTTSSINQMNTRRQNKVKMLRFRMKHPEIRYADSTLCGFFGNKMSEAEIIRRYYRKSSKPKGVYGTFSTPDPDIVSQLLVY